MRKSGATGHPPYYGGPAGPRHCSPGTHPTPQGSFSAHGSHFGGAGPWPGHGSGSSMGFYPSPHEPYASNSQPAYSGYHGSQHASLNSSAAFYGFHPPNTPSLYNRFENFQYPSAGPQPCKEPSAGPKSQKEASTADHDAASSSDSIEVPSAPPKRAQTQVKSRSSKPKPSKSSSMIGHGTCRPDKEIATRRKRKRCFKKPPSLKSRKPVVLVSQPSPPCSSPVEAESEETTKTVLKPTARRRPAEKPKRQKKLVSARVTSEPEVKAPASALSRSSKRTVTEYEEFQEIEEQAKKMRVLSPSKRKARTSSHVKLPTVLNRTQSSGQIKKFTKKIVLGADPAAIQLASEDSLPGTSVRPTQSTQPTAGTVKNLKSVEVVGVMSCTDCKEVKKVLQDVQVKLEKLEVTVDTLKANKSTPPRRPSTPLEDLPDGDEVVDNFPKSDENTQPGEMDLDECPVSNKNSQMNDEVRSVTSDSSDYVDADIDAEQVSDREVSLDRM
ncbi:hypothetical protein RvY_08861 [Ramazzottius varieornatus]|uniref:Uncharacterized protein n=1 Tax=Ramazzottius varieornatus TaxID=947166 RepID=A0A1D1VGI0_RAMVA|nr:hypothetical protein RvY_08861 [Ramazzottius varieornatus]